MIFPGLAIQEPEFDSFMRVSSDIQEMKESLKGNHIPRRRFDYVIGNPPYVGYNECSKQEILIFKMLQGKVKPKVNLNNIYGVNLHSIPDHRKKYAPKPNLYSFFIAVGLALLKDNGKLCYIIPQTILTAGDLDVLRYHLAKHLTIEKIITFDSNLFISRGLNQRKVIPTSSLIFVVSKKPPTDEHQVEIINYKNAEETISDTFNNILVGKKIEKKTFLQLELLKNVVNWNFIKQNKTFLNFYEKYKENTNDMRIYYEHDKHRPDNFYFDGSFNIPTKSIIENKDTKDNFWEIPILKSQGFLVRAGGFYPKSKKIKIAQGSQGMAMLDTKYKIIWNYIKPERFFYITGKDILPRFQQFCIASNNKSEIMFLLSIVNSKTNSVLFNGLLKSKGEKDFLVGVTVVKQYIRIPKITKENQFIKDEIIKRTEEMLSLEEKTLSDFVDFSEVMLQKFDDVEIDGSNLVLKHNGNKTKLKVKSDVKLVSETIQKELKEELKLENQKINLADLKNLLVIDFDKQEKLKNYIDDLVFALYFNVPINEIGPNKSDDIKNLCSKNKYYKVIEKT